MTLPTFIESPAFPDAVGFGSTGGPGFKTEIFTAASGGEQRNMLWQDAKSKFNVATGVREKVDMDNLLAFFYMVRGKAIGFRFKDWGDYELVNEVIGTGNGLLAGFQITKTYNAGSPAPYVRRITKPVSGTVTATVNSVAKTEGVDYVVDYTTGVITFTTPPATAQPIAITCHFDIPCRFDIDDLPRSYDEWQALSVNSVPVVELLQ